MDAVAVVKNYEIEEQRLSEDLYRRWIAYIDVAEESEKTYRKAMRQFFRYLSDQKVAKPTREDIISYKDYLLREHKPTTVQLYMTTLKLFFQWTAQENIYPDVAQHIKSAKVDASVHKRDYMTSRQVGKVLEAIDRSSLKGKRDYAMLSLMVTTGLRTVSIVNADVEDIRTAGDATVLYYKGKGHQGKSIYVKLAAPVEDAICDYLKARGNVSGEDPLFASDANRNNGERMTTRSVSRIAKGSMIDVGLDSDRLTAHSFRHTAATLNLLNGASLEETQQLLDHSSITTTMIYAHALERANNNSENRIASAIFGK